MLTLGKESKMMYDFYYTDLFAVFCRLRTLAINLQGKNSHFSCTVVYPCCAA